MNVRRGDVVLVLYPFASGVESSRRPALIVQNDRDNERLHNTIVAQITTNLRRARDSRHLLIEVSTPEGELSGLLHDSVVSCTNLATVNEDRIDRVIGHLAESALRRLDGCLKAALGIRYRHLKNSEPRIIDVSKGVRVKSTTIRHHSSSIPKSSLFIGRNRYGPKDHTRFPGTTHVV